MSITARQGQKGLSLIELMIAVVLGIFITGGMLQLFVNSKQSYRVQENLSRLQENGRFAMGFITKDIRMVDYWGCLKSTSGIENNLNASATFNTFTSAVEAADNNAVVDAVINGTDTITLKGAFGSGAYVTQIPANTSAAFKVEDNSDLEENELVIISDCIDGDLFQITNDPSVGGAGFDNIIHNTGAVSSGPGNANKPFKKIYGTDAQILKLNFATYSIQSNPSGIPALYRSINGSVPQELIEGVENMQILYGEDTDNDKTPNNYLPAGTAGLNLDNVISIRVSLLIRTLEDKIATQSQPYTIFGVTTTPADRIFRRVFTSTIALRNRLP